MNSAGTISRLDRMIEANATTRAGILARTALADEGPAMEGPPEFAPRAVRQRVLIRASMHVSGLPVQDAIVRNVSEHGMCVSTRGELPQVGESVRLALPCGLSREGMVRWCQGTAFGVALDEAIDLGLLGLSTQRLHAGRGRDLGWRLQGHFQQDQVRDTTQLRRCC